MLADVALLRVAEQTGQLFQHFPARAVQSRLLLRLQSADDSPEQEKVNNKAGSLCSWSGRERGGCSPKMSLPLMWTGTGPFR